MNWNFKRNQNTAGLVRVPKKAAILFLLILLGPWPKILESSQFYQSKTEKRIIETWQKHHYLCEPLPVVLLTAEGVIDPVDIHQYDVNLKQIFRELDKQDIRRLNRRDQARLIYQYLHHHTLSAYSTQASLPSVFKDGVYNCVTATALFFVTAEFFNLPLELQTTPRHIYAVLKDGNQKIRVEMTDPKHGFDFKQDQQSVIDYLLKYELITRDELKRKGAAGVYAENRQQTRIITREQLVSVVYNNRGVDFARRNQYQAALDAYEKALVFDPKSNIYQDIYQSLFTHTVVDLAENQRYDEVLRVLKRLLSFSPDEAFVELYVVPVIGNTVHFYAAADSDHHRLRQLIGDIRPHVSKYPSAIRQLTEWESLIDYNHAVEIFNQSDFARAYQRFREMSEARPGDWQLAQNVKIAGCQYATELANQKQFERAEEILAKLMTEFRADSTVVETVVYVRLKRAQFWEQSNRFEDAFQLIKQTGKIYPGRTELREFQQHLGCNWAIDLAQKQQWATVNSLLTALRNDFPTDSLVMETYIQIKVFEVSEKNWVYTEPNQAWREVQELYAIDAASPHLLDVTVAIFQQRAQIELDKQTREGLEQAHRIIREGLTYQPVSAVLKENLREIAAMLKDQD